MKARYCLVGLCILFAIFTSVSYAANGEFLGGWEGDTRGQGYGFLGVGTSRALGARTALVGRATVNYLYYEFAHDDSTTKATSPGMSCQAGFSYASGRVTASIVFGPEIRWNDEQTRATGGLSVASQHDRALSGVVQGYLNASATRRIWVTLLANYNGGNQYLFNRLSIERRFGASMTSAGLEGTAQGNTDIKSLQLGAFVGMPNVLARLSIRVSGGIKNSWSADQIHKTAGFFGVGFYTRF
jgi:hypothetical protein